MSNTEGRPFLRWAGGKRWLAPVLAEKLGGWNTQYIEPFLGGGAVFFALQPKNAVLADTNEELIACYRGVQADAEAVAESLLTLRTDQDSYYRIRSERPRTDITRAVRLIYLNHTSFNGLWRVNRNGDYNVPYGHKEVSLAWLVDDILAAGHSLQNAELKCQDFKKTIGYRRAGSLIFCDPPYITGHINNGFRQYNQKLFSWEDQEELARRATAAANRGVHVVISNAHHAALAELYGGLRASEHSRRCSLSGSASGRGQVPEYLFSSPEMHRRLAFNAVDSGGSA